MLHSGFPHCQLTQLRTHTRKPSPIFSGGDLHVSNKLLAGISKTLESNSRSDKYIKWGKTSLPARYAHKIFLPLLSSFFLKRAFTYLRVGVPPVLRYRWFSNNLSLILQEKLHRQSVQPSVNMLQQLTNIIVLNKEFLVGRLFYLICGC